MKKLSKYSFVWSFVGMLVGMFVFGYFHNIESQMANGFKVSSLVLSGFSFIIFWISLGDIIINRDDK